MNVGGLPSGLVHQVQYTFGITAQNRTGSNLIPNLPVTVKIVQFVNSTLNVISSQNFVTGNSTYNFGGFYVTLSIPNPGSYQMWMLWQDPKTGAACQAQGVPVT